MNFTMIKIYNWDEILNAKLDQLFLLQKNVKFGEVRVSTTTCTVAIVYPEFHHGIDITSLCVFAQVRKDYSTWAEFDNYWQAMFSKYLILSLP
jgi:hypothetical protein